MKMQIEVIKNSKKWISISLIFIFISIGSLIVKGLNYGIDFSGGSLFQLRFENTVNLKEVNSTLDKIGKEISQFAGTGRKVQISEGKEVLIRVQEIAEHDKDKFYDKISEIGKYEIIKEDKVGASVGKELKTSAIYSLLIGGTLIVGYITLRFEFMFALAAILALLHDIIIAIGGISILGYEIDTPFIAAVLTILGYSINNTIVVFDRIRETLKKKTDLTFGEVLNKSINQVMVRSLNTSVTTLLAIISILIFGGESLRTFITTLLIGMIAGTYSSIFIASPIIYFLEKDRDKKVENSKYLEKEEDEYKEKIVV
ncbi:MAG: protein translocase subunit SecF [Fusobacterium perfoetens]|uniref:protein translocase subunit SecF n=1 Tax=Fusobacterium perfoetens TaxID=852 RepID=UPI0023F14B31|nr:protein translocase subunit SecF [Fusobacterium perfoetens]MCI6151551.1 protein translocase subunit SecF [Fusobacterium perfoetens]MDY3237209.1 protein translocase subunit SecF [Fusobacterium perfoetens]